MAEANIASHQPALPTSDVASKTKTTIWDDSEVATPQLAVQLADGTVTASRVCAASPDGAHHLLALCGSADATTASVAGDAIALLRSREAIAPQDRAAAQAALLNAGAVSHLVQLLSDERRPPLARHAAANALWGICAGNRGACAEGLAAENPKAAAALGALLQVPGGHPSGGVAPAAGLLALLAHSQAAPPYGVLEAAMPDLVATLRNPNASVDTVQAALGALAALSALDAAAAAVGAMRNGVSALTGVLWWAMHRAEGWPPQRARSVQCCAVGTLIRALEVAPDVTAGGAFDAKTAHYLRECWLQPSGSGAKRAEDQSSAVAASDSGDTASAARPWQLAERALRLLAAASRAGEAALQDAGLKLHSDGERLDTAEPTDLQDEQQAEAAAFEEDCHQAAQDSWWDAGVQLV